MTVKDFICSDINRFFGSIHLRSYVVNDISDDGAEILIAQYDTGNCTLSWEELGEDSSFLNCNIVDNEEFYYSYGGNAPYTADIIMYVYGDDKNV